jgi:hypothetical protein
MTSRVAVNTREKKDVCDKTMRCGVGERDTCGGADKKGHRLRAAADQNEVRRRLHLVVGKGAVETPGEMGLGSVC